MPGYAVILTKSNKGIVSAWSPDYDIHLDLDTGIKQILKAESLISKKLQDQIELRSSKGEILADPKKLKELKTIYSLNYNQFWLKVHINPKLRKGIFQKIFSYGGSLANFLSVVSFAFMTILALEVSNSKDSSNSGRTLGIITALISIPISMVVYIFSGTANVLGGIGKKIDLLLQRITNRGVNRSLLATEATEQETADMMTIARIPRKPLTYKSSTILVMNALGLSAGLLINSVAINFTTFVDFNLLNDKAQKQGTIYPKELISTIIYILVISTFIAKVTFDGNFVSRAVQRLDQCLRPTNPESVEIADRNSRNDTRVINILESDDESEDEMPRNGLQNSSV